MTARVVAQPLTTKAFAPFGEVISVDAGPGHSANQGTATRIERVAQLVNTRATATPNLAVFCSVARTLPLRVTVLERHPHSTQAFLPMVVGRFLVCVAPDAADGTPDLGRLVALIGVAGQGVNYARGVWHHPIVALDVDAHLAMLAWEDGTPGDCESWPLPEPVELST